MEATAVKEPVRTVSTFKLTNFAKRCIDLSLATLALVIVSPLLVLVGILIVALEGRPVFYRSRRFITKDKSVNILKFRTMTPDATSPKYRLNERYMRNGFLDIPLDCEVYTPIGRILERTQIVEMLQLLNIIFHGMSFIGNRPLPKENIELLRCMFPEWERRFDSPAGLSGLSQIVGKLNQSPAQRIQLEHMYSTVYINPGGNILRIDGFIWYFTLRLLFFGKYISIDEAKALVRSSGGTVD
jgi:lipopolysaccharide/colanic/teichoic acid biosynthesis glycosyltransferase